MPDYVFKRLLRLIPTLLVVAALIFLFIHLLPGDPTRLVIGSETDTEVAKLVRRQLDLDQSLHVQFWHYMTSMLQDDSGTSMAFRRPVSEEIASRFMSSL